MTYKYRSNIEHDIHKSGKIKDWLYEDLKLNWVDGKGVEHTYTADFVNKSKSKIIEVKGYFRKGDRTKYKKIKNQNRHIQFIFAFEDVSRKIKQTKISYYDWCEQNGFGCLSWSQLI